MWHHWAPAAWRGPFPFEIGLFFFLTLTGFLITRILLRERAAGEAGGEKWRARACHDFLKRRMTRILVPCYAGMLFAIVVRAPDIREHWPTYLLHGSNFHMAFMTGWPSGTAHYWTLAIQMQFYLLWPPVVLLAPRRMLGGLFMACVALAPLSRMILARWFPEIHHAEAITTSALDYFGIGALLALAMERGLKAGDARLKLAAWIAFAGYVALYVCSRLDLPTGGFGYIQQTLLSVALAGLISSTLEGIRGIPGKLLDHPAVQHVGRLSYGLYLFHTPVPLLLGFVLPWLWHPFFNGPWLALRLAAFGLASWGVAYLCWRYLETGAAGSSKNAGNKEGGRSVQQS